MIKYSLKYGIRIALDVENPSVSKQYSINAPNADLASRLKNELEVAYGLYGRTLTDSCSAIDLNVALSSPKLEKWQARLLEGQEILDSYEPPRIKKGQFAAKAAPKAKGGKGKGKKNCDKGINCGGGCISAKKKCRKDNPSPKTKTVAAKVKRGKAGKSGGGGGAIEELRTTLQALDDRRQLTISQAEIDQARLDAAIEGATSAPQRRKLESERAKTETTATKTLKGINEERDQAVIDWIKKNQTPATDRVEHGMSKAESFYGVPLGGLTLFAGGKVDRDSPATIFVRDFATRKPPYPDSLLQHTREVYFSEQRNRNDAIWEEQYNMPGFRSAATGGDGKIVVYNGGNLSLGMFSHEAGHNLATGRYGTPNPGDGSYYATKTKGLAEVSDYAKKSRAESFAEDVSRYFETPPGQKPMRETHPERYKVIEDIINGREDQRSN